MLFLRKVTGKSMEPNFREGSVVVAVQTRNFKKGDVVVAFVDGHEVVKRVSHIDRSKGCVDLVSDNVEGSTYKNVSDRHLEGKVIFRF